MMNPTTKQHAAIAATAPKVPSPELPPPPLGADIWRLSFLKRGYPTITITGFREYSYYTLNSIKVNLLYSLPLLLFCV